MTIEVRSALLAARGRASELLRSTDGPWPHTRNHQSRDSPLSATTSASCSTFARRPQLYQTGKRTSEEGRNNPPPGSLSILWWRSSPRWLPLKLWWTRRRRATRGPQPDRQARFA